MTMGQTTLRPYGRLIALIAILIAACRLCEKHTEGRVVELRRPTLHDTLNSTRIATINLTSTDQK